MNTFKPIIYNTAQFEEAIDKLRELAAWPSPDDSDQVHRDFGRRLYHTDAIKAVRIARDVLHLLQQE